MLYLNAIFQAEGLDPNLVQLIRHKDQRFQKEGKSVFDVWYSERERFEKYQSIHSQKNKFDVGGIVASFVVSNSSETLFVGLYRVQSRRNWTAGDYCDPVWKAPPKPGDFVHDLHATEQMGDYVSRLVIEPWSDAINFVKRAARYNAKVLEIKRMPDQEQLRWCGSGQSPQLQNNVGDAAVSGPCGYPATSIQSPDPPSRAGACLLIYSDGRRASVTGPVGVSTGWDCAEPRSVDIIDRINLMYGSV